MGLGAMLCGSVNVIVEQKKPFSAKVLGRGQAVAAEGLRMIGQPEKTMECPALKHIKLGRGLKLAVITLIIKNGNIMVAGAYLYAPNGIPLRTFTPTWVRAQTDLLLIALIMTAIILLKIVDGLPTNSKRTTSAGQRLSHFPNPEPKEE